jgi:hypothetical protein
VPDVASAPDEAAALRVADARLRQVIEAKDTEVLVLREQLEVLRAEVAELRARPGASSRNSSKPPSADGLGRPPSHGLRCRDLHDRAFRKHAMFPSRSGPRKGTDGQAKASSRVRVRPAGCWLWWPQRRLGSRPW